METKLIARINHVGIVSTNDEQMAPICPICEALGIDPEGQRQRISRDAILSSVAFMVKATGSDGKTYEIKQLEQLRSERLSNKPTLFPKGESGSLNILSTFI